MNRQHTLVEDNNNNKKPPVNDFFEVLGVLWPLVGCQLLAQVVNIFSECFDVHLSDEGILGSEHSRIPCIA